MSKYRCPVCGATHKDPVANCRLCGQSLSPDLIPAASSHVAQPLPPHHGIKGVAFIGLGIVVLIVIGAIIFGVVRPSRQLEVIKDKVTGENSDGWVTVTDEQGKFRVDLPGQQTKETVDFPVTDNGKLTGSTTKISEDTKIIVGSGTVALPSATSGTALNPDAAANFLKDTIAPKWVAGNGITLLEVERTNATVAGYPALIVRSLQPRFKLNGKEAYAQAAFVLKGTTLYALQVVSIYKDAPQLDRMMQTFAVI